MASKLNFLRLNVSRLMHCSAPLQRKGPSFHYKFSITKNAYSPQDNFIEPEINDLENDSDDDCNILEDEQYNEIALDARSKIVQLKTIAVLQPWIKWGPSKRINSSPTLLLDEACALINSLPTVKIVYKETVNILGKKFLIFGSGTLERLKREIHSQHALGVFISSNHLKPSQIRELEIELGVKVFDRYAVVLEIFAYYSRTFESRLQIALAELPVVRKWTDGRYKMILDKREARLKRSIAKLTLRREVVRKQRKRIQLPTVSIVGYTNCGKTSLIKALSGDEKIQGENRLFATLDVTAHSCRLPCGIEVALIDTVGFIQDIPTTLISSFKATLQDAIYADVVVHVRDISHPDVMGQSAIVQTTLGALPLHESIPLITVNNKCDLIEQNGNSEEKQESDSPFLSISAITHQGLYDLVMLIEKEILRVTGRKRYSMRLLTGSTNISKLRKISHFVSEEADEKDQQYRKIKVVLNDAEFAAFKKQL